MLSGSLWLKAYGPANRGRERERARDNFKCREKKRKARQTKMKRLRELPRLRKRYTKSGRAGGRAGKGNQDIVKMTDKWGEKRETGNY